MQEPFSSRRVLPLLAGILLATATTMAAADLAEDCRAETGLYGIPPEQAEEYMQGCIQSRGGYPEDAGQPEAAVTGTGPVPDEATEGTAAGMTPDDNSTVEETTDGAQ
jgi:hypothetical protein